MSPLVEKQLELGGFATRALELDGTGPPVVLLHGWSDSADTWRPLMRELERAGRRAVALDMPGFGQASRLDRDRPVLFQLDRFATAAVRIEAERSGDVIVAGNSLGGCAAIRLAERPELPIAGVVPIAPAGLDMARWFTIVEGAPIVRALLHAPLPLPEVAVREAVGRAYRTMAFSRPAGVDPAVVASFTRHLPSRRDVIRVLATGRRLLPELSDCFRLDRVFHPMLLVWGEADRMVYPSGAERVLRAVPGARLELIEECGHCPQIEAPERLAELLAGFPAALARAA